MLVTPTDFEANIRCAGTHNASFTDISFGFLPAFRHSDTGETHLSVYDDGAIAAVHLLDHLPMAWVNEWDDEGRAQSLVQNIMPGFMRNGHFYTLLQIRQFRYDS